MLFVHKVKVIVISLLLTITRCRNSSHVDLSGSVNDQKVTVITLSYIEFKITFQTIVINTSEEELILRNVLVGEAIF